MHRILCDAHRNSMEQRTAADLLESNDSDNSSVPYTREIFDALNLRYEEPIANNRWDKPLFTLLPESQIPSEEVYSALYEKKPPPPNLATQNVRNNFKWFQHLMFYDEYIDAWLITVPVVKLKELVRKLMIEISS